MKKMITILALISTFSAFADTYEECWTDRNGVEHCTTVERPRGTITPQGW